MKIKDIAVAHELAEQMHFQMFGSDPGYELCGGTRPAAFERARAAITALGLSADEVAERLGVLMHEVVDKHVHSRERSE